MAAKTVERIFLFFFIYLPLQYLLVGVVGILHSEPWPAFVLPGFKNVYSTQNQVEISSPSFFVTGPELRKEIAATDLFTGVQNSQLQGFLQKNFKDNSLSLEAKTWLHGRLLQLYPDTSFTTLEVIWQKVIYKPVGDSIRQLPADELPTKITIPLAGIE